MRKKLIRITTVPISLDKLLDGQLNFMNSYFEVIAISSNLNDLEKIKSKEEVKVYSVEMTRKITPIKDIIAVFKMYLFFKKQKPFIVHTHTPKAGIVGMLASRLAGVHQRIHTVAGLPLLEAVGVKRKILNFVERLTYSCATKVYPNSFGLEKIIIENRFCSKNKIKVIANGSSNGIDVDHFSAENVSKEITNELKNKLGIARNDFVFIFVGRLVKDKGINELISAFESLAKANTNFKLLLVGTLETDLDPLFPCTIETIKNHPSIISMGWQEDVRPYFSVSNVLVFPSYREGFPNVVLQAGAMGLPSIVTNINGCNEIIEDYKNGLIIPVKNESALEQAMLKIYLQNELYILLKNNSRDQIVAKYKQELVWNALLNEYQNLLN